MADKDISPGINGLMSKGLYKARWLVKLGAPPCFQQALAAEFVAMKAHQNPICLSSGLADRSQILLKVPLI